ncbi:MAG TPA: FAD-linked oxidase C-terminal domain-containing protein [Dehalococcoidia bacterium]
MGITTRERTGTRQEVDAQALAAALRRRLRGEVRFDAGSRALYATDSSNYRQVPIGVVIPRDAEDVQEAVDACRRFGAPVLARGGGTSLAGQCCNVAVVLDMSKYMNRVLALDPEGRTARVQPGTVLDDLRRAAERHGLTFGPDPATHDHCTLGGMIGNNSCGVHSVMAGRTAENVEELEVLTYDGQRLRVGRTGDGDLERIIAGGGRRGEIYARLRELRDRYADEIRRRFPRIPRRVSGYGLDELLPEHGFHVARSLVGSESTCALTLEATVRLVESPPARVLLVLGYPDIFTAGDHVPEVMASGPVGLEALDDRLTELALAQHLHPRDIALLPEGRGWLLAEFGGRDAAEAEAAAQRLADRLRQGGSPPSVRLFRDPAEQRRLWTVRESGLGATTFLPDGAISWPGWEDAAVPPDRLGPYLREFRALLDRYGYDGSLYGHFGQGCVHTSTDFDLETGPGIRTFRSFIQDAADLVLKYGGSFSGEHGDGQARGELLAKMFGRDLVEAFREFKSIWDPAWKLNPGKVVDPHPLDQDLRLGTRYNPPHLRTHFQFPDDGGSFARATLRCVGVGKCRRLGSDDPSDATMCPSFMVLREEEHTTRGRMRLLFEMLEGHPLTGGWRDPHVREALDLCLSCKGCKGDCPVNVDVATYKAEFLSHYYAGRLRPRTAYTLGLVYWWARLASRAPWLANAVTQAPLLRGVAKRAAGVAPARRIPAFAPQTFTAWFRRRGASAPEGAGGSRVVLWADTFHNHFHPEVARAAVAVLERAGCRVVVPERSLCCGRPLYDYGMLDAAERLLREVLDALRPELRAGTPIVVLEPSCLAVFRDELSALLPHDEDAKRLRSQAVLLSEFLTRHVGTDRLPTLRRAAVVHGHCHQKAVLGMEAETEVLSALGLDYRLLPSGCCGMAGAFGFERGEHYDVSIRAGERVLLPAVREAGEETLIIANGFSCREQIAQTTDRRALHLAQVVWLAMEHGPAGPPGPYPEAACAPPAGGVPRGALLALGAAALGAVAVLAARRAGGRRTR